MQFCSLQPSVVLAISSSSSSKSRFVEFFLKSHTQKSPAPVREFRTSGERSQEHTLCPLRMRTKRQQTRRDTNSVLSSVVPTHSEESEVRNSLDSWLVYRGARGCEVVVKLCSGIVVLDRKKYAGLL